MGRIALFTVVGFAALLVVSTGVGQYTEPSGPYEPQPADQHSGVTPGISPVAPPALTQPPAPEYAPPSGPYYRNQYPAPPTPVAPVTWVPAETMTVKVYSVPDLVAAVQVHHAAPNPFSGNPELAQVMQQVQQQVYEAQASIQSALPTVSSHEVAAKLERLRKALQVAAPKKSWDDGGGDGAIEVYPDALCLIVRQTPSGHEAIADLLSQLRATHDVQIELAVEMLTFDGVADELAAQVMRLLNKELSPEELERLRKCGANMAMSEVVLMTNGQSAHANMIPQLPLLFTAVASADRSTVEFRTDVNIPTPESSGIMLGAFSQSRKVAAGKTVAFMMSPDQAFILLVTPKIVEKP